MSVLDVLLAPVRGWWYGDPCLHVQCPDELAPPEPIGVPMPAWAYAGDVPPPDPEPTACGLNISSLEDPTVCVYCAQPLNGDHQ